MASKRKNASSAASLAATGAKLGASFGPLGMLVGGGLGALGGWFGAGGRSLPQGVMSGRDARKLLKQGLSVDEILALGPVGSFHPGKSMRAFEKLGVSEEDAFRLLSSGGQGAGAGKLAKLFPQMAADQAMAGGGGSGAGPMGPGAFQDLLPALLANPASFARPEAAQWLQSLFPAQEPAAPTSRPPMPFEGSGGFSPWNSFGGKTPGPAPNPMLGLQALAGPFGNGGGPIAPSMANFVGRFRGLR